jgi:hypothetical protein
MHNHSRSFSGFTLYFDRSAFVSHDAIHGGKAQAVSLAWLLGGKKRFEQPRARFCVHAETGVSNRECDLGVAKLVMGIASRSKAVIILGLKCDSAAIWLEVENLDGAEMLDDSGEHF